MRERFLTFVRSAQDAARAKGIAWDMPISADGVISKAFAWDLTRICGATPPPVIRLSRFKSDDTILAALNALRAENSAALQPAFPFSPAWQDLIKAAVINRLLVRRNQAASVYNATIRPLTALATCCHGIEPWNITAEQVTLARVVACKSQASGKLAIDLDGVIGWLFDGHSLSSHCPIAASEGRGRRKTVSRDHRSTVRMRKDLNERKRSDRLPGEEAFWQAIRIAFTCEPITFFDKLRFTLLQILVMSGMRGGEAVTIPADWARWREYSDLHGRPAGDAGGISRSLMLRYFGEKQRVTGQDSVALYATAQHIPAMYEAPLSAALDEIRRLTAPLRATLEGQIRTSRIFPEYSADEFVPLTEIYVRLTGEPFVYADSQRKSLIARYRAKFDPSVLEEIEQRQDTLRRGAASLDNKVRVYFAGKLGSDIGIRAPVRDAQGRYMDRIDYSAAYFRVGELEEYLAKAIPTKMSDTAPLRLADGTDLQANQLLFLAPKRALAEERNDGICDLRRYAFVGRLTISDYDYALSGVRATSKSIFEKYGETDAVKSLRMTTHMFRHLQNTELFRLGVADTIITKRFNRRSLAQSHDYDHRSLAEDLAAMDIPEGEHPSLNDRALSAFRLIAAGKASGPIVDEFRRIQQSEGDEAAFVFLASEADGFHTTPYGHCLNSFTVEPCPKALECFAGCRHLTSTGLPEHRRNLESLRERYKGLLESIEHHPAPIIGKKNMQEHAQARLAGIEEILATPIGKSVFPDGPDLFTEVAKPFRGPFNDA